MFKLSWLQIFRLGILAAQLARAQEDLCPNPPCTGYEVIYEPPPPVDPSKRSFKPRTPQDANDPCPNPPCTGYGVIYEPPPSIDPSKSSVKPRASEDNSEDPCPDPPCEGYGVIYEPPPPADVSKSSFKARALEDDPDNLCPDPPCTRYGVIYEPPPPADVSKRSFKVRDSGDNTGSYCANPPCNGWSGNYQPPPAYTPTSAEASPSPVKTSTSIITPSTSTFSSLVSSSDPSSSSLSSSGSLSSKSSPSPSASASSSPSDSSFSASPSAPTSGVPTSSTISSRTAITTYLSLPTYISSSAYIFPTGSAPAVSENGTHPSGTRTTACGPCNVYADEVRLFYWPTATVNTQCLQRPKIRGIGTIPSSTLSINAQVTQSMEALSPQGGIDVVDGFTFTYPSTYFSVIGRIGVTNSCGQLGKTLDSPPPIAVKEVWTASYAEWPSTCRPQGRKVKVAIDRIHLSDIACPTWGLSNPFPTECDGTTFQTATVGPPYNPVILVPNEVYNYDPAWSGCNKARQAEFPCGLYDPPKALNIQQVLGPQPTLPSGPQSLSTPAAPGGGTGYDSSTAAPTAAPHQPETLMAPLPQVTKPSLAQENGPESPADQEPQPNDGPDSSSHTPQPQVQSGSNANSNSDPVPNSQNSPNSQSNPSSESNAPNNVNSGPKSQPGSDAESDPNAQPNPQDKLDSKTQGDSSSSGAGSNDPGADSELKATVVGQKPASTPQVAIPPRPVAQITVAFGGTNSGGSSGGASDENASVDWGNSPRPSLDGNTGGSPSTNAVAGTTVAGTNPFTPHVVTVLGQTLSAINPTAVVVASKTLTAGGPAFSTNGNYYSVGPSGSLVAGTLASGMSPLPALTFGNAIYTANSASQIVIGSHTIDPGQQITVSGTPISLARSSNILVVGTSTQSLGTAVPSMSPALLTFDGSTYTADTASQFVIGSQTLTPGGVVTVSGTAISEAPSGSGLVVIGGSTQVLSYSSPAGAPTTAAVMTLNSHTYTADASGNFVIDDQTLRPGSMITVSGTPISEAPGATNVVIHGSTEVLSMATTSPSAMSFFSSASSHTRGTISNWAIWSSWSIALLSSTAWFLLGL